MKGNRIVLRPARVADAALLARALRPADRQELAASHPGCNPADCLAEFITGSRQSVCLECGGEVAALAGIYAPVVLGCYACVWLLTGQQIEKCKFSFVRLAKRCLSYWLTLYPVLGNEVDSRYRAARRFIRRLGGKTDGQITLHNNRVFLHVIFRRNTWEE